VFFGRTREKGSRLTVCRVCGAPTAGLTAPGGHMYIGIGTIVLILIIVVIVLLLRGRA
jgi:hypothetical protein